MAWIESSSASFRARHGSADADDAAGVLDLLERTRAALGPLFPRGAPGGLTVVLHEHPLALALAEPALIARWATADAAARRWIAGWPASRELHVLAPRTLRKRAAAIPGSAQLLALAPAALYARVVIATSNPTVPPPHTPARLRRYLRRAWILDGAAQWFAGQTEHARPLIARALRESPRPRFPPSARDAGLLGGTVIDLLVREEGVTAAISLACARADMDPRLSLVRAFGGRPLARTEAAWRAHLERMTSGTVRRRPQRAAQGPPTD